MNGKGWSNHVPVAVGEESVEDLASRPRRRSRWRTIAAAATALSVLVVPAMAEADVSDVNQQRAAAGLPPVYEDGGLTALAQQKAADMAATGNLVHTSDLGGTVGSVLPSYTGAAENVGLGPSTATVTSAFMGSPTHRSAILGNYNTAGVGVSVGADGRVWVAQLFALSSAPAPAPTPAPAPAPAPAPVSVAPTAAPTFKAAAAPRPAARSRRRCRTRTRRATRTVNGRRVTRVIRTRRCTGRKVTKRRVVRRRLVRS